MDHRLKRRLPSPTLLPNLKRPKICHLVNPNHRAENPSPIVLLSQREDLLQHRLKLPRACHLANPNQNRRAENLSLTVILSQRADLLQHRLKLLNLVGQFISSFWYTSILRIHYVA